MRLISLSDGAFAFLTDTSSAAKAEDDPVTAEYDVFLTPAIEEQIYLLQFPNRSRTQPYNERARAMPTDMRIKPKAGFMEMDIDMNTKHNFNKYMSLKWGDARRISKEVHNNSGTYGPAAGLIGPKARSLGRSAVRDKGDRELELENDLRDFNEAEKDNKTLRKQTLGGQIIRHDAEAEAGKPYYFVGAFRGNQLHLSKVHGTVQMRPTFHHLDAEEERARLAVSRAQAEADGPAPEPVARGIQRQVKEKEQKETTAVKLTNFLDQARQEPWLKMEYVDEDMQLSYDEFNTKLKVQDPDNLPHLKSQMDNDAFLDAISTPRHDSPTRRRKRAPRKKEMVEIGDEDGENDAAHADQTAQEARVPE